MLGVVNLDKPVGPTSHDMVGLMRRLSGTRRIGHAGTLDPLASGVLPILIGAATRFSQELTGGRKRYDAVIRLGWRSATDDAEGPLAASGADLPPDDAVAAALAGFTGSFQQRPPAFSARKQAGRSAHRAARAGAPLTLPSRAVTIEAIELLDVQRRDGHLDVRVDVRCGPGTYIRSLARDLGERLGCGGYLLALRRTEAAGLSVDDARTPSELEALAADGRLADAVLPVEALLPLPQLCLAPADARRFAHGSAITLADGVGADGRLAIFDGGRLVGIGTRRGSVLKPHKVLSEVGE